MKIRERVLCEKCKQYFTIQNIKKHTNTCTGFYQPPNIMKKYYTVLENGQGFFCKYCNVTGIATRKDLRNHWKICEVKTRLPKDSLGRVKNCETSKLLKKQNMQYFICKFCGKEAITSWGNTSHQKYCEKNPGRVPGHSHPCSDQNRLHQAMLVTKRIGEFGSGPNFNKSACKYFDQLSIQRGWNLKHALNGGEKRVGPYSVDAYDEKYNIVVEYNEKFHYRNSVVIERDKKRAAFIYEQLRCQFFVFNSVNGVLEKWY